MEVEVVKWGNSSAVRLPSAVLKEAKIALGDKLIIKIDDGKVVLESAAREYKLADLLKGITKKNLHSAVDFGAPMGREAL